MDVETFRGKVLVIMSESIGHPLSIGHAARRITELYAGIAASEPCAYHERELLRLKAKVARVEALADDMASALRGEIAPVRGVAALIRATLADPEEATDA